MGARRYQLVPSCGLSQIRSLPYREESSGCASAWLASLSDRNTHASSESARPQEGQLEILHAMRRRLATPAP